MGSDSETLDVDVKSRIDHFVDDISVLINVVKVPESSVLNQVKGDLRSVYYMCKACGLNFYDHQLYFTERLKDCY